MNEQQDEFEQVIAGTIRPAKIPANWVGEAVSPGQAWRWYDPDDLGNSVTFHRGYPQSEHPHERHPYVLVRSNGVLIGRDGEPVPE